ncbi:MAG: hypothetical protein BM556_03100 [Bacteriovorax sp. MedPE-SWde]|nr:MAG: hypothetical protein BM556_03100 [Bacteriovorax sp. MedPE-SWde]
MDHSHFIGKLVLSTNFGVGKVVDIDNLGMGERLFLVIESEGKNVKNFVPLDDEHNYRVICTKDTIEKVVSDLGGKSKLEAFTSKKDRIDYFKTQSKIQDVVLMGGLLVQLEALEDRSSAEQQLYSRLVDSIALEHSIIMEGQIDDSKDIITARLQA